MLHSLLQFRQAWQSYVTVNVELSESYTRTGLSLSTSLNINYHTHTHTFKGPFSRTTRVSRHQKGKTDPDFTEARDSEWQWHQLDHMQVCNSLRTDNHASTPPLKFFTGRMNFLLPNQQRQSTDGNYQYLIMSGWLCDYFRAGKNND